MLGGIIFDMDGVLIDSHPVHRHAWCQLFSALGRDFAEADLDFVLDGAKREEILRHFLGDLNAKQLSVYGRVKEEFYLHRISHIQAVAGVFDFLRQLDQWGIPAAVATSASRSRTIKTLSQLDIIKHFSVIVTGDEVLQGKPDPALFRKAADLLKLPASSLLVIEDAVSGIHAASAAQMKSIGIGNGSRSSGLLQAGAAFVLRDFCDLPLTKIQHLFS